MADESRARGRRVLVGVTDSLASRHALYWASDGAKLRGAHLVVCHVVPPDGPALRAGQGKRRWQAERLLADAAAAASRRQPGVPVATALLEGWTTPQLLTLSGSADLIVFGVGALDRSSWIGSAATDKAQPNATQARCPIVAVPESYRTRDRIDNDLLVVAGWAPSPSGERAVAEAAIAAQLRGVPLQVVHVTSEQGRPAQPGSMLTSVRRMHPDLDVSYRSSSGDPVQTLLDAARTAGLLVIGCHDGDDYWNVRLGDVAGEVLRQISVPLMLTAGRASSIPG